jgi:hypothetical protein
MEPATDFVFGPLPPIEEPATADPLAELAGKWTGQGFNVIWRPHHPPERQDRFLELNMTNEQLDFGPALRNIPNRGLLQPDISLVGLSYLQQISDAKTNTKQHFEPGIWVMVPKTSEPQEPRTVARLASIPHGTTILVQGIAHTSVGAPSIPDIDITPFVIGRPDQRLRFPEQTLSMPSQFRTGGAGLTDISQQMVDNPNSVLHAGPSTQITTTTTLHVSSHDASLPGGGVSNIAFLEGGASGPNGVTASVTATFWLETLQADTTPRRLQYSQLVVLNFQGLSWPHVTVATLRKQS